ncbi:MAG: peptidase S41, partial [Cytophagales bacterium]
MKTVFLIGCIAFCSVGYTQFAQTDTLATKVLSAKQMQHDFIYLRRLLTETHPGLYRYTPKVKMQSKLDSIYNLLDRRLPFYEFYKIITV